MNSVSITKLLNGKSIDDLTEYFKQVNTLRKDIYDVVSDDLFSGLEFPPNPFYDPIVFDGSLVMNVDGTIPKYFCTPLGKWLISRGGLRTETSHYVNILNSLGIKYEVLVNPNPDGGKYVQILEDQYGNKYTPIDNDKYFSRELGLVDYDASKELYNRLSISL